MPDQDPSEPALADESSGAPSEPAVGPAPRRTSGHTVARVVLISVVALALLTGATLLYAYKHFSDNLNVLSVEQDLEDRPAMPEVTGPRRPLNILVMGSDTRSGEGNAIDNQAGEGGSDTTILMHLSADRTRAYGVSIPRDSIVDRPACDHGAIPAADNVMWNEAFAVDGPSCTIQQFEQLSGIKIDHYVVVDFNGFRDMVDAVGGVEVCLPQKVDDTEHDIHLPAGTQELSGDEALSYVRLRYYGPGIQSSDIGRMKRQQAFIASMANKVVSADTLANPIKLARFLEAATTSLTVDPGLRNVFKIARLGVQFKGIGLDEVKFFTIPWKWDPQDPNHVVWTERADQVWRALKFDERLTRGLVSEAISAEKPTRGTGNNQTDADSGLCD